MVEGKSFTSNTTKLLKHMDKLQGMQEGKVSPIMIHIAPTNACNLSCDFCCFDERDKKQKLTLDDVTKTLDGFYEHGVRAVEFTGGGEPTIHPNINEMIEYAHNIGYKVGMCTNSTNLDKVNDWSNLEWVRLSLNLFDQGKIPDVSNISGCDISAAYVYDDPNPKDFYSMVMWAEKNKVPTRVAVNAIKSVEEINNSMSNVEALLSDMSRNYVFLSDFNLNTDRRNDNCYMHMIKPLIFPDRNIYACPSSELAVENKANVNEQFKIGTIDNIADLYKEGVSVREHDCSFCKYSSQNSLIEDILTETKHNSFA